MTNKDTKLDKIEAETIPELKDGSPVLIDGEEYIYTHGHFERPVPEQSIESHFYLYFDDRYEYVDKKGVKEIPEQVHGCPVKREGKTISVDIYPLLKEIFGKKLYNMESSFKGIRYESDGTIGSCALAYNSRMADKLEKDLSRMLDLSFVNQNQLRSSKEYLQNTLSSFFTDFWNLF